MNLQELTDRVKEAEKNGSFKLNIVRGGGDSEGIWACFVSQQDKEIYESNQVGETFYCFLLNHALINGPSWGARIKVTSQGNLRPTIFIQDFINQMNNAGEDYPSRSEFIKASKS
jgi:hypothetical protein